MYPSPHGHFRPCHLPAASDPACGETAAAAGSAGAVAALGAAAAAAGRVAREGRGSMGGAELCKTRRQGRSLEVGEGYPLGFL